MKLPEELQFIQNSRKPQRSTDARLDGKTCVITGATSGIGYEAAKKLAEGGANLVIVCRNPEKAALIQKELTSDYGVNVDMVLANFQELYEVRQAGLTIRERYPEIHILISNAGVFNKRRQLTPDGYEMTFGVIHLASFLLTKLLTENLKAGAPSRILYISSEAHRFGGFSINDLNWEKRPFVGLWAYGAAKTAQIHTATLLAEHLKSSGVTVNIMHPGAVRTNIGMNNSIFYRLYKRWILRWFLKDPEISANAIYFLAADPSMKNVTGKFYNLTIEEKPAWYSVKADQSQTVWEKSEAIIQPYLRETQ
jgi:NAD(P)-dependent dehydrogenase (short-subunit alcohol dehydrogenase family)